MKINLFKVLLYDFLIIIIANTVLYFLLVLIFHDSMSILNHGDEFFWMSVGEMFGIAFFALLFEVTFLLPLFYIQKQQIESLTSTELFVRFMPLVTLITGIIGSFILLIGSIAHTITGEAWVNFWLLFGISYLGLVAFVYLVKTLKKS